MNQQNRSCTLTLALYITDMAATDDTENSFDASGVKESDRLVTSPESEERWARYSCSRGCLATVARAAGRWTVNNLLLVLTIASVVVGMTLGAALREAHPDPFAINLISFPGEILLRMLKMLILPLIVFSLIAGLGSLDSKVAGSLGWKTVLYYFTTTMIAVALGVLVVMTIRPGSRYPIERTCSNASTGHVTQLDTVDAILDLLR